MENFQFFTPISEEKAKIISPITLAFLGDAVYSLFVRQNLVLEHDMSAGKMQKLNSEQVSAHGQSILMSRIVDKLTEDESSIFKRGRNAKKGTRSKNASVAEYNISTGIEAVIGYLYLCGKFDRIGELLNQ